MVGNSVNRVIGIAVVVLVLLSVFAIALPFNFQQTQLQSFQIQKAPQQINSKYFTLIDKSLVTLNKPQAKSVKPVPQLNKKTPKFIGKITDIPFGGKKGKENNGLDVDKLCNTPGFACGGYDEDYEYGAGDVIRYEPHATDGIENGRNTWFHP